jgi:hypothetical protein
MNRVQLWSCGGGRQSAGIAALMVEGRLRLPDHACMVAIEWEVASTFAYMRKYIRPALKKLGVPFTMIPRKKYATKDFTGGEDGKSILLPIYSDQSGEMSKLPEYCSGEWKREVATRWANEQPGWKDRGVDTWIGISWDERDRRRNARKHWIKPVYPLLDWFPKSMGVSACLDACNRVGWPEPPRSRCRHCPNQADDEWLELPPDEFNAACDLEDELRLIDPHAWFHKSCVPLRDVKLVASVGQRLFTGGCSAGMCV